MWHIMKYRVLTIIAFMTLVLALTTGTAYAANCGGLPVTGSIIPSGTYNMTDNCTISAVLEIVGGTEVTINGNGFTFSGSNSSRGVFLVNSGATLNLNGVTVVDGVSTEWFKGGGGGALNNGTMTVINSTFSNNTAPYGGAIYNYGNLTVSGSHFLNNSSNSTAGAIGTRGPLTVTDSTFAGNSSSGGGAISIDEGSGGVIMISASTFINNNATSGAGAITGGGPLTITNSTFSNNSASWAGAIQHATGPLTINNSTFRGNRSAGQAGAIEGFYSTISVNNSVFSDNSAMGDGGGIFINQGFKLEVANTAFSGNSAEEGGGIYTFGTPFTISNSTFSGNSANTGSSVFHYGTITTPDNPFESVGSPRSFAGTVTCSQIVNNSSSSGTDVHLSGSSLTADNNWWGAETGPNTPGADTTNVAVSSWLSEPDPACAAVVGPLAPAPPMLNEVTDGEIVAYDVPDDFYGRVLMQDGAWQTNPGTIPQELIANGVILAVDIFQLSGQQEDNEFGAHVPVCLLGSGRLIFLDATTSPRTMVELETFAQDGMTCGWIPNAGTLVLIESE